MIKVKQNKLLIIILLLVISVGFAYLSTRLDVNGLANIKKIKWNLYFDNVKNNYGEEFEVTAPTTSGANTTELNFEVALEDPGDSYSFNVYIVNNGTIDAMFDLKNDNTIITEAQRKIYDFDIRYKDGIELNSNYLLAKNSTETLTITISYKKDIEIADLPSSDNSVNYSLVLKYTQAKNAVERPKQYNIRYVLNDGTANNPITYTNKNDDITLVEPTREGYTFTGWTGGKNIFDDNAISNANTYWSIDYPGTIREDNVNHFSYQKIIPGDIKKYYVSFKNRHSGPGAVAYVRFVQFDYNDTYLDTNERTQWFVTLHPNTAYFILQADMGPNGYFEDLMVEEGDEPTSYEPYVGTPTKTITIPSGSNGNRVYTANWEAN